MIKNFAVEVIKTLKPSEIEELRLFLQSPYFSRGHNKPFLLQLFEMIAKAIQLGTLDQLDKAKIFATLYPDKPILENKIDKLFTELKGLLQTFLVINCNQYQSNEPQQLLPLARELRLRGLETYYFQTQDKIKLFLDQQQWESIEGYLFRHQVAVEAHEWESSYNKTKGDLNIPVVLHELDNYYFTYKTELLNRLLLQGITTQLPEKAVNIYNKSWHVSDEQSAQSTLLRISLEIFRLLATDPPQPDSFYLLLNTIQKEESKLSPETLAQFYSYLRNVCILLIDSGKTAFYFVLHQIQKDNLKRGYYYHLGKITPYAYGSITQVALYVKEFTWARNFVENHKNMIIDENETQDFYRMNLALCLFEERKFEEALGMIPFGSTYSHYHLLARRLELKIYYELKSELLEFKIDAFKMFVSRAGQKALSKNSYEMHLNYINIMRQLNNSIGMRDKVRSELLINRINEKKRVADRTWLLEKAQEIGNRKH